MKFFAVHALFHVSAEIYYKKTAQNLRGFFTARGAWFLKITENVARGPRCVFVNIFWWTCRELHSGLTGVGRAFYILSLPFILLRPSR